MDNNKSIEVTEEMINAGVEVLLRSGRITTDYRTSGDELLVQRVFLAMLSAQRQQARHSAGSSQGTEKS